MTARDVGFSSDGVTLAGTLWMPAERPRSGVVMVGGSGPSDRHNDVLFPPIREALLARGIAVLSYDKRGVGASTGSWVLATIDDFAADAARAFAVLSSEVPTVGLFGHSEGGWVVLRAAAACPGVAFVVTNSTPGGKPADQDRHAVRAAVRSNDPELEPAVLALYDRLIVQLRAGASFDHVRPLLAAAPTLSPYFGELDETAWRSALPKLDHDPEPDVIGLSCPYLAVFGTADPLVPVVESAAALTAATALRVSGAAPLTIQVFPGADHRLHVDGDFAAGYLNAVGTWVGAAAAG